MTKSSLFSSGFQLAPYVISSGLLRVSWNAITSSEPGINSNEGEGLSCKVLQVKFEEKDLKIIVFETIPPLSQDHVQEKLISSSDLKEKKFLDFDFLCTKSSPPFYVNETAVSLLQKNQQMLDQFQKEAIPLHIAADNGSPELINRLLKAGADPNLSDKDGVKPIQVAAARGNRATVEILFPLTSKIDSIPIWTIDGILKHMKSRTKKLQINSSTPLIVTGRALAGSVASLFTLSLLDTIGSGKNCPLCITFGSSLIGDKKLQQAISCSSTWNSCFLHVVSHEDPLPRRFITNHSSQTIDYMPFGTFLLSSDIGSTCSENPDFILELLKALGSTYVQNQGFQTTEYGNIVESLYRKAICRDTQAGNLNLSDPLLASISLQFWALRLTSHIQDINTLEKMKNLEEKFITSRTSFDPSKKLNDVKIYMAQLEWYKKKGKNEGRGYYDSYRNMNSPADYHAVEFQKKLTQYWVKMVEEAEMKPQKEGAAFRTRWLFAGTNYRRMVEPLIIAQYYSEGGRDYVTKERSKHFEKLEEWLKEENTQEGNKTSPNNSNSPSKHNVELILTVNSCFWARVEEALLSMKELEETRNEEARNKLVKFEEYVYEQLKKYEVSPEVFLPKSSYMRWWNEYKAIRGSSSDSTLASFMSDARNYKQYAEGAFEFL